MTDDERVRLLDDEHLRLLRIGYLVSGFANLLWVFFPLIYVAIGIMIFFIGLFSRNHGGDDAAPAFVGLIFAGIGGTIAVIIACMAALKLFTAKALRTRTHRVLCLVTAGISCLAIPYGTLLGIFTFMVLQRPTVIAQFEAPVTPAPPAAR